jgi:subtilase family serine protease
MLALVAVVPPLAGKDTARTVLRGNVHPAVANLMPLAKVDDSLPMEHMILSLRMGAEARADLERLLRNQQDPASASYHQWLTTAQFKARFAPSAEAIQEVTGWLAGQGFTVEEVGATGLSVTFSGDAATVEQAFRTPIMRYRVNGRIACANAVEPSIPAALARTVGGVVSLHNIPKTSLIHRPGREGTDSRPLYYNAALGNMLAPADFATIYGVASTGYTGAGAKIAVIGRTYPNNALSHWATFRTTFGLASGTVTPVFPNGNPGDLEAQDPTNNAGEDAEADLDVEWAGAMAPQATIYFVCGANTSTSDGIDNAIIHAVDNNLADIITVSFGACESYLEGFQWSGTSTYNDFYTNYWSAAAALGITVCVASGDSGAAGCDAAVQSTQAKKGLAVNGLASTPYAVCVGGTRLSEGTGSYWTAGSGTASTATGYIPEVVWNESAMVSSSYYRLFATGGGASTLYAKPSWQAGTGVPSGNHRYVPDVALSAAGHDAYVIYTQGSDASASLQGVGGTSASTPAFAGLVAQLVQKTGSRQGNILPGLYALGARQYGAGGASVFHDITVGNNSVPGLTGYSATSGYDPATGLGSLDTAVWFANWGGTWSLSPTGSVGVLVGDTLTLAATGTGVFSDTEWAWAPASGATVTVASPNSSATFKATAAGTYTVTAAPTNYYPANAGGSVAVVAHANLTGSGTGVTGADFLEVLGHWGASSTAYDVSGDGLVDADDLDTIKTKLGW